MTEIKPCKGGQVRFGLSGNDSSVYATKFVACISPYQDEKYGIGLRVHNLQSGKNAGSSRCTVCGMGKGIVRL